MANLGMRAFHATIELSIQNRSTANAGAYGHINQARLVLARAPSRLAECARVSIVLQAQPSP